MQWKDALKMLTKLGTCWGTPKVFFSFLSYSACLFLLLPGTFCFQIIAMWVGFWKCLELWLRHGALCMSGSSQWLTDSLHATHQGCCGVSAAWRWVCASAVTEQQWGTALCKVVLKTHTYCSAIKPGIINVRAILNVNFHILPGVLLHLSEFWELCLTSAIWQCNATAKHDAVLAQQRIGPVCKCTNLMWDFPVHAHQDGF